MLDFKFLKHSFMSFYVILFIHSLLLIIIHYYSFIHFAAFIYVGIEKFQGISMNGCYFIL